MDSHDTSTLAVIGPFREAGFALHWLHPRTKRPIGDGWSEAPVATLEQLCASHVPGNNLGVRLGSPSLLTSGTYLHVLDFDIRVAELADEAWAAFKHLFPGVDIDSLPMVASGAGGESRHLYFTTSEPFRSKRLATSDGKHRTDKGSWSFDWEIELFGTSKQVVLPPSIHPATGAPYRWIREFDLAMLEMGVAPTISATHIATLATAENTTYEFETREPLTFKPGQLERDLDEIEVSALHYDDWIILGQALHHQFGGSDEGFDLWLQHTRRSEKFGKKQTPEQQIREMRRVKWRSFGKYRGRPVTMATVRQWVLDARRDRLLSQFDEEPEAAFEGDSHSPADTASNGGNAGVKADFLCGVEDLLGDSVPAPSPAPAIEVAVEEIDDIDNIGNVAEVPLRPEWVSLLDVNEEGAFRPTLHNVELIICNDPRIIGLPQLNDFTQETVQRTQPGTKAQRARAAKDTRQLTGRVWQVRDTLNGDLWSDDRDFAIRTIIEAPKTQGGYGLKVSDRDLRAAVTLAANHNAFHPVREYLENLEWDGQSRCELLWVKYVRAPDDEYHRSVAMLALIAAVTRIFEPGHKFDFATILEGLQGKRKSTLISTLGRSWFAELDGDFHDTKQMVELMQGAWIMEIPELTGFSRADVRALKAFISRQHDRARLAYARRAGSFARQCIFIGSTNDREYLRDDTGGRRFWPVKCNLGDDDEIDTDQLSGEVDQIWAEAVTLYRRLREAQPFGTLPLYLRERQARITAARLQESRRLETAEDAIAGRISAWLDRPANDGGFEGDDGGVPRRRDVTCLMQVFVEALQGDIRQYDNQRSQVLGRAMSLVPAWEKVHEGDGRYTFAAPYGRQRAYRRVGTTTI